MNLMLLPRIRDVSLTGIRYLKLVVNIGIRIKHLCMHRRNLANNMRVGGRGGGGQNKPCLYSVFTNRFLFFLSLHNPNNLLDFLIYPS